MRRRSQRIMARSAASVKVQKDLGHLVPDRKESGYNQDGSHRPESAPRFLRSLLKTSPDGGIRNLVPVWSRRDRHRVRQRLYVCAPSLFRAGTARGYCSRVHPPVCSPRDCASSPSIVLLSMFSSLFRPTYSCHGYNSPLGNRPWAPAFQLPPFPPPPSPPPFSRPVSCSCPFGACFPFCSTPVPFCSFDVHLWHWFC